MDEPIGRGAIRARLGRQNRVRQLGQGVAAVATVTCLLTAVACAGSAGGTGQADQSKPTQVAGHDEVVLLPITLGAGDGGWCLTTLRAGGCPTLHMPMFAGPIIFEHWGAQGPSPSGLAPSIPVREGFVLTTNEVAAVSFEDGAPIATRAESTLPVHLRAAVVELRGGPVRHVFGVTAPPPLPRSHFSPLNAKGEPIIETGAPGPPFEFEVPSRNWGRSARAPAGVCSVEATAAVGLLSEGGSVMTAVRPHPNVRGREFVDCVRASYVLNNWPLEANVLLDAARPGVTPAALPAMRPLAGHPGVFQAPGVEGETLARRIPGAWLVVVKGEGLRQRLTFLEQLRVAIHL